ncbi:MAG: hypothetical protein ABSA32_06280 [Candidatus Acidiferrales bacterium]|jgi:uncharacterized membrane protein YukC
MLEILAIISVILLGWIAFHAWVVAYEVSALREGVKDYLNKHP